MDNQGWGTREGPKVAVVGPEVKVDSPYIILALGMIALPAGDVGYPKRPPLLLGDPQVSPLLWEILGDHKTGQSHRTGACSGASTSTSTCSKTIPSCY